MLSPEVVMNFIRWVLAIPQQPEAQLIRIDEQDPRPNRPRNKAPL